MIHSRDRPLLCKMKKDNKILKTSILEEKVMTKKIVSVVLVIITILSTLAITASAASYSTGNYVIAASNGSNVRTGAGTGYSKVGAASKGVSFYVSKVNGNWGYTSSIMCVNGAKSGWVCLDYCTYKGSSGNNSSRATYNDVFASTKGSGYSLSQARQSESTTFTKGKFVYVWGFLHDANDNLYKTYGSGTCNMTLSIYRPDGSCAHTYTYKDSDNNWIGQNLDQTGTWKIQSKITGSLSGTNTRTITVKESSSSTYYTLIYNANGGYNAPSSQRVKANTNFYLSSSKPSRSGYIFLGWSTNKNAKSASFSAGDGVRIKNNVTLYAVWERSGVEITGDLFYNYPTVGDIYYLSAKAYPSNTSKFTWSSSNSKVVSINSSGKMTAKAAGTATITVKTDDGRSQSVKITVSSANKWRTGNFDSGYTAKGYTTVTLNKNAGNAYIYIYTYDAMDNKSSGQMHVTLRDNSGNWIWEGDVSSGTKLKLGNDHSQYRVYIAKKTYPNTVIGNGDDFINVGKCQSWAINCASNCYIA